MPMALLALLSAVMVAGVLSASVDPDPLAPYRWTHRLLVLQVPDTESGRATLTAFEAALDDRREDVIARDLLVVAVGDLPRAGDTRQPAVTLGGPERLAVRRRLGMQDGGAQLVLIGKDGGVKARQPEGAFDLAGLLQLIDGMPMRRAETRRRPGA